MNTIQILIVVAVVFLSTPTVFLLTVFLLSVYYCKKEEREKMHHSKEVEQINRDKEFEK